MAQEWRGRRRQWDAQPAERCTGQCPGIGRPPSCWSWVDRGRPQKWVAAGRRRNRFLAKVWRCTWGWTGQTGRSEAACTRRTLDWLPAPCVACRISWVPSCGAGRRPRPAPTAAQTDARTSAFWTANTQRSIKNVFALCTIARKFKEITFTWSKSKLLSWRDFNDLSYNFFQDKWQEVLDLITVRYRGPFSFSTICCSLIQCFIYGTASLDGIVWVTGIACSWHVLTIVCTVDITKRLHGLRNFNWTLLFPYILLEFKNVKFGR